MTLSLLAALPGACTEKGEETTTTAATETSGDSTGASDDSTGATGGDSSGTGEPTTGEPTTGEPSTVCVEYVDWVYGCGLGDPLDEEEALGECEREREQTDAVYGPDCGAKSDAYIACLSKNACDDFDACDAEAEAIDMCLPPASAVCTKFAMAVVACEPEADPAEVASGCQFEINAGAYANAECGAAVEAMYDCYGGLTCEEIAGETPGCTQQVDMTEALCPGEDHGP